MLDIRKLASLRHVPFQDENSRHPNARRGWLQFECPQCRGRSGSHGGFYLGWALDRGAFNCWRCGKLEFWNTLERIFKLSESNARRLVTEHQIEGTQKFRIVERQKSIDAPLGTKAMSKAHHDYLSGRKFDSHQLEKDWSLQGTTNRSGKWNWRIIIPIHDQTKQIIGYQGRSIGNARRKYETTEDKDLLIPRNQIVYGIERCLSDSIIIVEGVTGVWRFGADCGATLGIAWNDAQANILRKFKNRFIIFDPDEAAQKRALKLAQHLAMFPGETEVVDDFETDPGEFSDKKAAKIKRILGIAT